MKVLTLFFLSGATALVYEVVWSKYLSLMFGSTVQAQTVVLAVFMGGLALGNRLFGARAAAMRQPLAGYGYVELAIGLFAFAFPAIHAGADRVFISVGSNFADSPNALLALKATLAVALLIVPTVLMGGTLPLLASWLQRSSDDATRGSARFYSTNSLGAVFGSFIAGFYLVANWGMAASLQLAAFANLLVGAAAILISRKVGDLQPINVEASRSAAAKSPLARAAFAMVAVTGAVSMALEVISARVVILFVGGSLQAFALVLVAFILGIGIGSGIVAGKRFAGWQNERTVLGLLLTASGLIGLFIIFIKEWAFFYSAARYALAPNEIGYIAHQLLIAFLALGILGLPAAVLGAVLPIAIRMSDTAETSLSDQVGRLLTWNTIGAVVGVLMAGFVLMPNLGIRGSLALLAVALALVATVAAWARAHRKLAVTGLSVALGVSMFAFLGGQDWRHVLGAGIFRMRNFRLTDETFEKRKAAVEILYYKDAADATIAVERGRSETGIGQTMLRVNGKADASSRGDYCTQLLCAHLPMAARPDSKNVFILGFGSGVTAGAALAHPIESLTIVENCKPVLVAAGYFDEWNRRALQDPRARVRHEDARTILKLSPRKYDVIISQPSNPWVASNGGVFSREYYELCASRLAEKGIMAQWVQMYEIHDGIVELIVRTFASVYPHFEIWESSYGDLILLGANQPWESNAQTVGRVFERPTVRADFANVGINNPNALMARQVASQRTAGAIVGDGPVQSDEFPVLEYAAPEAMFIGKMAERIFKFDERTRQGALASKAKRDALSQLSDKDLHAVFTEYSTGNKELLDYLKWRARHVPPGAPHPVYDPDPLLPIAFRSAQSFAIQGDDAVARAEAALAAGSADWETHAKTLAAHLEQNGSTLGREKIARLAGALIRAALANGNAEQARAWLAKVEAQIPAEPELQYFSRLLAPPASSKP